MNKLYFYILKFLTPLQSQYTSKKTLILMYYYEVNICCPHPVSKATLNSPKGKEECGTEKNNLKLITCI